MCGISGIINWNGKPSSNQVEAMSERLSHRGPDASGSKSIGSACFGHRRLSIIDVSENATQPMADKSGRYMISFNGEIYNYIELKQELRNEGVEFKTASDTEVLLKSWIQWGKKSIGKLVGMFAFAIWDYEKQELHLVRDRLGEKPLYYTPLDGKWENGIVFTSEIQALRGCSDVKLEIDNKAMEHYLYFGYTSTKHSIYKNVNKVAPANIISFSKGQPPAIEEYWSLDGFFKNKRSSYDICSAKEGFFELFNLSVSQKLRSDVPLGVMLSGGIDSSLITSSVADSVDNSQTVKSFCAGFKDSSYDESSISKQVSEYLGISHSISLVDYEGINFIDKLTDVVGHMDEPLADNSFIPMLALSEFISKHAKVCLSGDGADEMFLGYETYVADKMHQRLKPLLGGVQPALSSLVNMFLPTSFNKVSFDFKLRRFLKGLSLPYDNAHSSWRLMMNDEEINSLLGKEGLFYSDFFDEYISNFYSKVQDADILDQHSYVDIKTWLADDILVKTDRSTMAYSIEGRSPFLDHRLVEFAASLPTSLKLHNSKEKKHILRQALKERLPDNLIQRKKLGFNAPISNWLLRVKHDDFIGLLNQYNANDFFDKDVLIMWFKQHNNKQKDNSYAIYTALVFLMWGRK